MPEIYDGIILGGGHNGLILQGYLARSGLRVVCLERADEAGGGLTTTEYPDGSGFRHNTHSFYHRGLTGMPWYRDLQLDWYGARYLQPPLNVALLCRDGRSLEWWTDFEKTYESFASFDVQDADSLRQWRERFQPIVRRYLIPEVQAPPLPPDDRRKWLERSADGRLLLETSKLSPLQFVQREFRHPVIQAGLLFFNGLREVDLRLPGFGHHIPALLASDSFAQMCRGGSRQLSSALQESVRHAGGEIRTRSIPRAILVDGDRVRGVETEAGEQFLARHFVASALNPQQTFLELLDSRYVPSAWRQLAAAYEYNLLAPLFGLYVNLSEPPRYLAAESRPELADAFMIILGIEHPDQLADVVSHHERGTLPSPVMWGSCPSRFDLRQAPREQHTAFLWEKLPYRIDGDAAHWDAMCESVGDRMLRAWSRYAPNVADAVLDRFTQSPLDTERRLPNMRGGDLLVGSFARGQVGYHRPFPGAGHYRGHLRGLYLCGSSCHPGGNVTGMPGYNCAQVLLNDLGIHADWMPPPLLARWRGRAGL